ncbi:MAG: hypothetical protein ACW975_03050 [Candidatus Thorarchaeota archaeon]
MILYPCFSGTPTIVPMASNSFALMDYSWIAADSEDFADIDTSDVDLSSDKGTHSSFLEQQSGPNSVYDTLSESNTGNPAGSEWLDVDAFDSTWSEWEINGTSPYLDAQDATTNIVQSKQNNNQMGWWDFVNTSLTGTLNLNLSIYCRNNNGGADDAIGVYVDYTGTGLGTYVGSVGQHVTYSYDNISLGTHTVSEVDALRVYFLVEKSGGADYVYADHMRLGVNNTNYELDLEVQWTNTIYDEANEYLCIYAGSTGAENISVDVWYSSAWQNLIQDLTENSWNNISVLSYLDSSMFTIRFKGGTELGDLSQDSWQIDATILHTWSPNFAPQNDLAPNATNIDDTDNLYARYRAYQITVNVSDQNGYDDIDYVELTLTSDDQVTEYWTVRYDEVTDIFSEQVDTSDYISLDVGSSLASKSGNDIDLTFNITVNWNHPDVSETDAKCYVIDSYAVNDLDYYENNWDIETRLDYSILPAVTSDDSGTANRGDPDEVFNIGGTVIYYGSGDDSPASEEVDVWVLGTEYGTNAGPWSDATLVSGQFDVVCYADDQVGQDTYTIKVVVEGTGSGASDLHYTSSITDTYIADHIEWYLSGVDDSRIDVNANGLTYWKARYEYDGSDVTATLNGSKSLIWNGTHWTYQESKSTVQAVGYRIDTCSENTHGITGWTQSVSNTTIIWDRIKILTTITSDNHIDYGTSTTINVTAQLEYDSTLLSSDDTLFMNDTAMIWDTDHFYLTAGPFTVVGKFAFYVNSSNAIENTFDITVVNLDGNEQVVIWDRILILTTAVDDSRIDINSNAEIRVTAQLEYNSHPLGVGDILYMEDALLSWDGGDSRFEMLRSKSLVGLWRYYVNSTNAYESTYEITVVNLNGNEVSVIWDRILILTTTADDSRVDISTNAELWVTAELEYDGHSLGNGDILYMNGEQMTWDEGDSRFELVRNQGSVGIWLYYVNSTNALESTNGITVVNLDGNSQSVIWDRIMILTTDVDVSRVDVDTNAELRVTAWLEYDEHPLGVDDTLYLDNAIMNWDGTDTRFELLRSQSSVGLWIFYVNSTNAHEDTYGITVINLDGNSQNLIWDRIKILTTTVDDDRIDYGTSATVSVTAELEYDNHPLGPDDTLFVNNTGMAWSTDHFELVVGPFNIVDLLIYFVNSTGANEDTYGISAIYLNGQNIGVVWDRIRIVTTTSQDNRINYDTPADIRVTAVLEYDSHLLGSGDTLYMNNTAMTWATSFFQLQPQFTQVGQWIFFVNSTNANEATYGITVVNLDGNEVSQIWDRILILTTTADDDRLNVDSNVELRVTAQLEYGGHNLGSGDTLYLDDVQMIWDDGDSRFELIRSQSSVGLWGYFVNTSNALEVTYGISIVNVNGNSQDVIWDRILILTTITQDNRIDYGTLADIRVTAELEYDHHVLGAGDTLNMNNTAMTWATSFFQLQPSFSQVGLWSFFVNSTGANEVTYGITVVNLDGNEVSQIWDRILILTTSADDSRVNVNSNVELQVTASLEFDGHGVGSGDTLYLDDIQMTWDGTNSWFDLTRTQSSVGLWTYFVNASNAYETTYGIAAVNIDAKTQDVIWDRILILTTTTEDSRINYGAVADIRVTAELEYDGHQLDSGDTLYMTDIQMTWISTYFQLQPSFSQVGLWSYFVNASGANEATYGITLVNLDGNGIDQIWDRIIILTTTVDDDRIDVSSNAELQVTAELEYDNHPLGSGDALYMDDVQMTWDGTDSRFELIRSQSSVGLWLYFVNTSNALEVTYGISTVNVNGNNQDVIWDRILILTTATQDSRIDYGTSADIRVTAELEYDHHVLGAGDTLSMNNTAMTWVTSFFQLQPSFSQVGIWSFFVNSSGANEVTHGITAVYLDGNYIDQIWDRILILTTSADDSRVNLNSNVELRVTAELEYDGHILGSGDTLYLDDVLMTWDAANSWFDLTRTQSSVGLWTYFVNASDAFENTHEISVVNIDAKTQDVIWDRILILTTTTEDDRIDYGAAADIRVTAELEFDGHQLDSGDTLYMDDTQMTWISTYFQLQPSFSQVGIWSFFVNSTNAIETTYGITLVN